MKLTYAQRQLAKMYAMKANVDEQFVIEKLENKEVTFTELAQGILWTKVK